MTMMNIYFNEIGLRPTTYTVFIHSLFKGFAGIEKGGFAKLISFLALYIVKLWNLVNKISGEPLVLGSCYLAHRFCSRCR